MATSVSSTDAGNLTGPGFVGSSPHVVAMQPATFAGVDPDEMMLPAEDGVLGLVGPVTGAQHVENAAQPGSR